MTNKPFSVPSSRMKVDINDLDNLPHFTLNWPSLPNELEMGLYNFNSGNIEFDFLYSPSKQNRLFIFFSGYASRKKLQPPVFQRWNWADAFPGHCLYISDPTLKLYEDLGLAWYIGNKEADVQPTIVQIIKAVATKLNIPLENVILYGSSGGGFAALKFSSLIPEAIAIAINPQIDITVYKQGMADRFLKRCFDGISRKEAIKLYPERLSILPHVEILKNNKIFYIQNKLDTHHYETHFQLFSKEIGLTESNSYKKNHIEVNLFEHPKGHEAREPAEIIEKILKRVITMTK